MRTTRTRTSRRPTGGEPIESLLDRARHLLDRDVVAARLLLEGGLEAAVRARDRGDEAELLAALAQVDLETVGGGEARERAERALALAREVGSRRAEAAALLVVGDLELRAARPDAAHSSYLRAHDIAREEGLARELVDALCGLGRFRTFTAELETARTLFQQAVEIARTSGYRRGERVAAQGGGVVISHLGDFRRAIEIEEGVLAEARRDGDLRSQAHAHGSIGSHLERLGESVQALAHTRSALELFERLGARRAAGVAHNNLGVGLRQLGEYAEAIEAFLTSLDIAEECGDRQGELIALNNIGYTYDLLGEYSRSGEPYLRSLAIAQEIGDRQSEAYALDSVGRFHQRIGDARSALLHHLRGLRLNEEIGDRYGLRVAHYSIGTLLVSLGERTKGEEHLRRSLELATEVGDRYGEAGTRVELGEIALRHGELDRAAELLESALAVATELEIHDIRLRALRHLAELHEMRGEVRRRQSARREIERITTRLFDEERSRRTRHLLAGFEERRLRSSGAALGLDADDLSLLSSVLDARPSAGGIEGSGNRHSSAVGPTVASAPAVRSVEVRTFGELQVTIDGRRLGVEEWKRKRARDLFKLLLLHHRRPLSIDEIVDRLWGSTTDRNMELLVMNAISHIRRALEPERRSRGESRYLRSLDRSYLLDLGDDAFIDHLRFKELIVEARHAATAEERRLLYREAVALHRGEFLEEDRDAEWAESERSLLKDAWLEALEYLAGEHLASGALDAAATTAREIIAADSTNERAWQVLLQALAGRGRAGELREAWEQCRRKFREELGVDPPKELQ